MSAGEAPWLGAGAVLRPALRQVPPPGYDRGRVPPFYLLLAFVTTYWNFKILIVYYAQKKITISRIMVTFILTIIVDIAQKPKIMTMWTVHVCALLLLFILLHVLMFTHSISLGPGCPHELDY